MCVCVCVIIVTSNTTNVSTFKRANERTVSRLRNKTVHSISYKIACATSDNSDQPRSLSKSLQGTLWLAKYPKHLQADSEYSDQPAHQRRLI